MAEAVTHQAGSCPFVQFWPVVLLRSHDASRLVLALISRSGGLERARKMDSRRYKPLKSDPHTAKAKGRAAGNRSKCLLVTNHHTHQFAPCF
jgi:hypothetical protein